jgi:hypothetical protein
MVFHRWTFTNFFLLSSLILIRLLVLMSLGESFEGDEITILYWCRQWILNNQWFLITSQDVPAWETLGGYLFAGFDLLGFHPRVLAFFLGLLEIYCVYLWIQKKYSPDLAWTGALFMLAMPYHVFFSLVTGPLAAGLWTVLYLYCDDEYKKSRFFVVVGGFLYYASFRFLLVWFFLKGFYSNLLKKSSFLKGSYFLKKSSSKEGASSKEGVSSLEEVSSLRGANLFRRFHFYSPEILGIGVGFVLLYFFSEERQGLELFFKKGQYLMERGWGYFIPLYFQSFFVWFIPFWQKILPFFETISYNDLGRAFSQIRGWDTPLSILMSVYFILGIIKSFQQRKNLWELGLIFFSWILVGWTATFVHFVFLIPVVIFIVSFGFHETRKFLSLRSQKFLLLVSLFLATLSNLVMVYNLKNPPPHALMQDRVHRVIMDVLKTGIPREKILFVASNQVHFLRYFAEKHNVRWTFFYENPDRWILEKRAYLREHGFSHLLVLPPSEYDILNPDLQDFVQKFEKEFARYQDLIPSNFVIKSEKHFSLENGVPIGILYEVDSTL